MDPAHAGESFQAVADGWLASRRDVAESTRARDGSYLRNQVLPHLGRLSLREVTPEVLDTWVATLDELASGRGKHSGSTRPAATVSNLPISASENRS